MTQRSERGSTTSSPDSADQVGAGPTVSVIVPHYRDLPSLDRCLAALGRQTFPKDDFEIVVADNNSPEGEAMVARTIAGRARLTIVAEKGAGAARNGGVAQSRGRILAFTDSDCVPDPDWLTQGVRALEGHDFIGGRMKVLVGDPRAMTPEEAFESLFAFDNETYVKRKGFTVSANLLCKRTIFDRVGGFLAAGISEDCEWCYRARDAGYKIGYAPASIVGHPARRNWAELMKKWRRVNSDNFGLMTRTPAGRAHWFLRSFALPLSAVLHTPKALFGEGVIGLRQRLAALSVLYRLRLWRVGDSLKLLMTKT